MSRYHFNIYDGRTELDPEGVELPDLAAVKREAISLAGASLASRASEVVVGEDWRLEATDHTGLMLFRVDVIVTASPAINDGRPALEP